MECPQEYRYAETHEWVLRKENGRVIVGITEHAQSLLGDVVFIDLPEIGFVTEAGQECAVIESVKAASDIFAPINGTVTAINEQVVDAPDLVNSDAFGAGWLFEIEVDDPADLGSLLDADSYLSQVE